jgi:hypothetical protein
MQKGYSVLQKSRRYRIYFGQVADSIYGRLSKGISLLKLQF